MGPDGAQNRVLSESVASFARAEDLASHPSAAEPRPVKPARHSAAASNGPDSRHKSISSTWDDCVHVAVRLRPLNAREKARGDAGRCVWVGDDGRSVSVTHPETGATRDFRFHQAFDSFGLGSEGDADYSTSPPASQQTVYDSIGASLLSHVRAGFNATCFAYGQTGAGKSYSMVGTHAHPGVVPRCVKGLFESLDFSGEFLLDVAMLEVYNERVHDLLAPRSSIGLAGLKVRISPAAGVYVAGLSRVAVSTEEAVMELLATGTKARTIAATEMNRASSRAHTVFEVRVLRCANSNAKDARPELHSMLRLVDLAGSERAGKANTSGMRLREGASINRSLSSLGNVIRKLAEAADAPPARQKAAHMAVPYRDSVLTLLLKDSLGGNSRSVMIAALSPSPDNYEETVSTLRYATAAMKIRQLSKANARGVAVNVATALRDEVAELKAELKAALRRVDSSSTEVAALREKLRDGQGLLADAAATPAERSAQAAQVLGRQNHLFGSLGLAPDAANSVGQDGPHLLNLNADPQLSGRLLYAVSEGATSMGTALEGTTAARHHIRLAAGPGVHRVTCVLTREAGEVRAAPAPGTEVFVNGAMLEAKGITLTDGDRIAVGFSTVLRFHSGISGDGKSYLGWEDAQAELASNAVKADPALADALQSGKGDRLDHEIARAVRLAKEAGAMAQEMARMVRFKARLGIDLQQAAADAKNAVGAANPMMAVGNACTAVGVGFCFEREGMPDRVEVLSLEEMEDRIILMREQFLLYRSTGESPEGTLNDSFWEPPRPRVLATASLYTEALLHGLETDDNAALVSEDGAVFGTLSAQVMPRVAEGKVPGDALAAGEPLNFQVRISAVEGAFNPGASVTVRYRVFGCEYATDMAAAGACGANFAYDHHHYSKQVTDQLLNFLMDGVILFELLVCEGEDGAAVGSAAPDNGAWGAFESIDSAILSANRCLQSNYNRCVFESDSSDMDSSDDDDAAAQVAALGSPASADGGHRAISRTSSASSRSTFGRHYRSKQLRKVRRQESKSSNGGDSVAADGGEGTSAGGGGEEESIALRQEVAALKDKVAALEAELRTARADNDALRRVAKAAGGGAGKGDGGKAAAKSSACVLM